MHCGVLCDKDGNVKRTWTMVSDIATVPVEDGDHVIEWEVDHGEELPHTQAKIEKIKEAIKEQERIPALKDKTALDAHLGAQGRVARVQTVRIGASSSDPIYYGHDKGLHHRRINDEGDIVDIPSDSKHRLEQVRTR